jgi:hypothetical protein
MTCVSWQRTLLAVTALAMWLTSGAALAKKEEAKPQLDRSAGYVGFQAGGKGGKKKGDAEADSGLDYDPDKAAPDGYTDAEPYDPYYDPNHPLKNPDTDPGKGWERTGRQAKPDGSFGALSGSVDWDWGDHYFNDSFIVVLNVVNNCKSDQPTSIFVTGVPGLSFPSKVMVPPGPGGKNVIGNVTLPSPPIPTGIPGEPPMGHVDLPKVFLLPGQKPPHQPNFVGIGGEVVAWHPEAMDIDGQVCYATRVTYKPTGHIHWRPPKKDKPSGPSKLATTDPCTLWWNIEEQPPGAKEKQCTSKIRALAAHFVDKVLPPFMDHAPADWKWLKALGPINRLSIGELLAMKARASQVAEDTQW